jgi:hypothetical protein
MSSRSRIPGKVTGLSATLLVAGAVLLNQGVSPATPGQGAIERTDVGRARHTADGVMGVHQGNDTIVYTATMAPGATSGWHRHPGGIVVLVQSGTFTTYGLDAEPCVGVDIPAGGAYFEDNAAGARYPHFVRNRGDVPAEVVVIAFDVPPGGSPRTDADAPAQCPDPK